MFENLIFMVLSFLGIVGFIISIITLSIGFIKKSRKFKNTGVFFLMIPIFCFGLIQLWYKIIIPYFNSSLSKEFSGVYSTYKNKPTKILKRRGLYDKERFLILKENGRYVFDTIPGVLLWKTGNWKTGGIDGVFNFYNNNNRLIGIGMPSGSGENCRLKFEFYPNPKDYKKRESLILKKIHKQ